MVFIAAFIISFLVLIFWYLAAMINISAAGILFGSSVIIWLGSFITYLIYVFS